jgi:hypothetical protein
MKNLFKFVMGTNSERTITRFGAARLVRRTDGVVELRGGQAQDRTAAKEWISLFMHEAVPHFAAGNAG